jgi:hypothetical protein
MGESTDLSAGTATPTEGWSEVDTRTETRTIPSEAGGGAARSAGVVRLKHLSIAIPLRGQSRNRLMVERKPLPCLHGILQKATPRESPKNRRSVPRFSRLCAPVGATRLLMVAGLWWQGQCRFPLLVCTHATPAQATVLKNQQPDPDLADVVPQEHIGSNELNGGRRSSAFHDCRRIPPQALQLRWVQGGNMGRSHGGERMPKRCHTSLQRLKGQLLPVSIVCLLPIHGGNSCEASLVEPHPPDPPPRSRHWAVGSMHQYGSKYTHYLPITP